MAEKSVSEKIHELEKKLGIPIGFLWEIRKDENDWSYVIKMHSLIEAAITYLIVNKIGKPELERSISQIELSNNRSGIIPFLKETIKVDDKEISAKDYVPENLKFCIFIVVVSMLETIYSHTNLPTMDELFPMGLAAAVKAERERIEKEKAKEES